MRKEITAEERKKIDQMFRSIKEEMRKRMVPEIGLLNSAYYFAYNQHANAPQNRRKTGDPYIIHPLEVAKILAEAGFESSLIAAAILHDVIEDCGVDVEELRKRFGTAIADAVNAISKVNADSVHNPELSKQELDELSDAKFWTETVVKNNRKAFYIKLADRIHNLRTINVFPEEMQKEKARHTRRIVIPAAKKMHIFTLVDVLESLCLKIENPQAYYEIRDGYRRLLMENQATLEGEGGFKTFFQNLIKEDETRAGKYVVTVQFCERYEDSIYRHLVPKMDNANDWKQSITKENIPLYDIGFIVNDSYKGTPISLFMSYYEELHRSKFRITVTGIGQTMGSEEIYFRVSDRYGNQYRLFVQTESQLLEFSYGASLTGDENEIRGHIPYFYEEEPDEPEHPKIVVYRKDGSRMEIEDGATVLDFAFKLHKEIGLCAVGAKLNGTEALVPVYTRLRPGDMVEVISEHHKDDPEKDVRHARVRWFEYLHTRSAIKTLSRWMENNVEWCGKDDGLC